MQTSKRPEVSICFNQATTCSKSMSDQNEATVHVAQPSTEVLEQKKVSADDGESFTMHTLKFWQGSESEHAL